MRSVDETPARTGTEAAFDSVTAWIEQAQERFDAAARSAVDAQNRTTRKVDSAMIELGQRLSRIENRPEATDPASLGQAFKAIERIETRLEAVVSPGAAASGPDTLQNFQGRISQLTERLASKPRTIGRREVRKATDIQSAVAEIRRRQADLDLDPSRVDAGPVRSGPPDAAQTDLLASLRGDIAGLTRRFDGARSPDGSAIEQLNHEFGLIRDSLGSLATRSDLAEIERSVASVSDEVAEARRSGTGLGDLSAELDHLHRSMQKLAETQGAQADGRLSQHIEQLSRKLDSVVQPGAASELYAELRDLKAVIATAAPAGEIRTLGRQLADMRDEIAALSGRQVDVSDFASLRSSVEDVRKTLASPAPGPAGDRLDLMAGLRPIESLLHALVDRLDRLGIDEAGPAAIEQLERHVAALSGQITRTGGTDPAVVQLGRAMDGLMAEVAAWRDHATEIAERAARAALAGSRTADAAEGAALTREFEQFKLRCETAERRTEDSLALVTRTLSEVASRVVDPASPTISRRQRPIDLDEGFVAVAAPAGSGHARPSQPGRPYAGPAPATRDDPGTSSRQDQSALPGADPMADAERPLAPAQHDEILLEPGASRPGVAGQPADIDVRSNFIAAARRAAQAAATEAAAGRGRAAGRIAGDPTSTTPVVANDPRQLGKRLRALVERHRRPLLIGAATIVLALGTLQVVREMFSGPATPVVAARMPADAQPRPAPGPATRLEPLAAPAARAPLDPTTTQSITAASSRPDLSILPPPPMPGAPNAAVPNAAAMSSAPSLAAANPLPQVSAPQAPAPQASAPTISGSSTAAPKTTPVAPEPAALPAGLKAAALTGDPVASYEYASRLSEGRGLPKDAALAAKFFEKAAERGIIPAQYRLGTLYEKGSGVTRDLDAAKNWYRRAAERGNARAMHNLAVLLADGGGGKPDYAAAGTWFGKAANQGIRDSQYNYAVLLARGLGASQDLVGSYTWFAVAASGGDADAGRKRDEIGAKLSAAELARAKNAVETLRPAAPVTDANEVQLPAGGFSESPKVTASVKKPARDGRV